MSTPSHRHGTWLVLAATTLGAPLIGAPVARAQPPGTVAAQLRIADGEGGFLGPLRAGDDFGAAVAPLGDVDGDGVADLVVGCGADDDGGTDRGAAWVLFLAGDGSVRAAQKISAAEGGFTGRLDRSDRFGASATGLGDLDGDGVADLVIGASGDDDGGTNQGAVWVLFLQNDGTVRAHRKIAERAGGFFGRLDSNDLFGAAVAHAGDLDGDGVADLVVGAPLDDDGGTDRGAVWILYLRDDGSVRTSAKISSTQGGFEGDLDRNDQFGTSVAGLGDVDGDGTPDLAVGARGDDDGGTDAGATWQLFLDAAGSVKSHRKISNDHGGFTGNLEPGDNFGGALSSMGDLDDDGIVELGVGASFDDDGGPDRGALWILFLDADGAVRMHQKISSVAGGFAGPLTHGDRFGGALGIAGDLDGDGRPEMAGGARKDEGTGTVWILSLHREVSSTCPADLDGDGAVGPLDVDRLFEAWGACDGCREDLDADGAVGFQDLLTLLRAWGDCDSGERATPWRSKRAIRSHLKAKLKAERTERKTCRRTHRSAGRRAGCSCAPTGLSVGKQRSLVNRGVRAVRREYWRDLVAERRRKRSGHTVQD